MNLNLEYGVGLVNGLDKDLGMLMAKGWRLGNCWVNWRLCR